MHKQRQKPSIAAPLILWLCGGLVLLSLGMGALHYRMALQPLQNQLEARAADNVRRLATTLRDAVWKLDDSAIQAYFRQYVPSEDLTYVRIRSEFGDIIYHKHFRPDSDVVTTTHAVTRNGVVIGSVKVAMSRASLRSARRTLLGTTGLYALAGMVSVVVLVTIVMRLGLQRPVDRLLGEIRAIAQGDYTRTLPAATHAETDTLFREVNAMAAQIARVTGELRAEVEHRAQAQAELQRFANQLEHLVATRTRELTQSNAELQAEIAERKKAQAEILSAGVAERQSMGRDLHDGIGQQLVGILFLCQALVHRLEAERSPQAGALKDLLAQIQVAVDQTRRMSHGFAPVDIASMGLREGLDDLASRAQKLYGIDCRLAADGKHPIWDREVAAHLYYIAQEAINNAVRHGHAKRITLRLRVNPYRGYLAVENDGTEISKREGDERGLGFRTMRYRAEACGGWFKIGHSQPAGITVIAGFKNRRPNGVESIRGETTCGES